MPATRRDDDWIYEMEGTIEAWIVRLGTIALESPRIDALACRLIDALKPAHFCAASFPEAYASGTYRYRKGEIIEHQPRRVMLPSVGDVEK